MMTRDRQSAWLGASLLGAVLAGGLLAPSLGVAQQASLVPEIRVGMTYEEARPILKRIGYVGDVPQAGRENCGSRSPGSPCVRYRGEVESCAGTGEGRCRFVLASGLRTDIVIITAGPDSRIVSIQRR
jgi:hypothetical protein